MMHRCLFFVLPVFAAAACSAQKTPDYRGEALAKVHGTIITTQAAPPAQASVLVYWNNFAKNGDSGAVIELAVRGTFPAKFTIDVVAPPPSEQLNDFNYGGRFQNEVRIGVAAIYAVVPGSRAGKGDPPPLGVVEDYVIVYLEHDAVPGTFASTFVGGPLAAGFHLLKVTRPPKHDAGNVESKCYASLPPGLGEQEQYVRCHDSDVFDKLHEAEQGFATEITLRLAPENELDVPNYN